MKKPKTLLHSKYRKDMWNSAAPSLQKILTHLPIEEAYVVGSFSSKKRRPADIDFTVFFKTKSKNKKECWSLDFVVAPNNEHGKFMFEDVRKWMMQKYGKKNFEITRIY